MKKVEYMIEEGKNILGVTIRILDHDAIMDSLMSTYAGFTLDDAIKNANARLNKFGYEI